MEPIIASIITAFATLGATVLSLWLRQKHEHRLKEKNILKEHSKRNQNVYAALKYTMGKSNADRVYVYEFHNGDVYYSGGSQQKFSCSYEEVKEGISSEAQNSQNFRVSNFHHFIDRLINEEGFCCDTVDAIEDVTFKHLLQDRGVKSFYAVPIKTLSGKIIGLLGIDYVKKEREECANLNELRTQANIISGYLS